MLIIGKEYCINSPYGHSGIYTLDDIILKNTKDTDVMYIFINTNGYKFGFINRLYKNWKMEISLYERPQLPPSPPFFPLSHEQSYLQPLGQPNKNLNFDNV